MHEDQDSPGSRRPEPAAVPPAGLPRCPTPPPLPHGAHAAHDTQGMAVWGRQLLRHPASWVALGLAALALLVWAVYWIATADERMERHATESLRTFALAELFSLEEDHYYGDGVPVVQLRDGKWARQYVNSGPYRWEISRTASRVYPFEATVTIPYQQWATIMHDSREEAEADEHFYPQDSDYFFADPRGYSRLPTDRELSFELSYDCSAKRWITRSSTRSLVGHRPSSIGPPARAAPRTPAEVPATSGPSSPSADPPATEPITESAPKPPNANAKPPREAPATPVPEPPQADPASAMDSDPFGLGMGLDPFGPGGVMDDLGMDRTGP